MSVLPYFEAFENYIKTFPDFSCAAFCGIDGKDGRYIFISEEKNSTIIFIDFPCVMEDEHERMEEELGKLGVFVQPPKINSPGPGGFKIFVIDLGRQHVIERLNALSSIHQTQDTDVAIITNIKSRDLPNPELMEAKRLKYFERIGNIVNTIKSENILTPAEKLETLQKIAEAAGIKLSPRDSGRGVGQGGAVTR